MNEFEMYQSLLGTMTNALVQSQYLMSMFTGYLLIAFFIGERLSFFQVSFANSVFVVMYLSVAWSLRDTIDKAGYFIVRFEESGSDIPMSRTMALSGADGGGALALGISVVLVLGCLYFMWTVRHPKEA